MIVDAGSMRNGSKHRREHVAHLPRLHTHAQLDGFGLCAWFRSLHREMKQDFIAAAKSLVRNFRRVGEIRNDGHREGIRQLEQFARGRNVFAKIIHDDGEPHGVCRQRFARMRRGGDGFDDANRVGALRTAEEIESAGARRDWPASEIVLTSDGDERFNERRLATGIAERYVELICGVAAAPAVCGLRFGPNCDLSLAAAGILRRGNKFFGYSMDFSACELLLAATSGEYRENCNDNEK